MTSAFGTIKRTKLIEILESFLWGDEVRIIRIVPNNATLDIKSFSKISNPFFPNFDLHKVMV